MINSNDKKLINKLNKNKNLKKVEKIIKKYSIYGKKKSYNCLLFQKSLNKIIQKLGEEVTEFIIESKDNNNDKKFLNEGADLIFNFLILLNSKEKKFKEIINILYKREKKGILKNKIERLKEKIQKK